MELSQAKADDLLADPVAFLPGHGLQLKEPDEFDHPSPGLRVERVRLETVSVHAWAMVPGLPRSRSRNRAARCSLGERLSVP